MEFLVECGGPYRAWEAAVEENVIWCLIYGQYVLIEEEGKIKGFAGYYRIHPGDLEKVRAKQRPCDIRTGNMMYVVEFSGPGKILELVKGLRKEGKGMQGFYSHHWKHGFRAFPMVKGD